MVGNRVQSQTRFALDSPARRCLHSSVRQKLIANGPNNTRSPRDGRIVILPSFRQSGSRHKRNFKEEIACAVLRPYRDVDDIGWVSDRRRNIKTMILDAQT